MAKELKNKTKKEMYRNKFRRRIREELNYNSKNSERKLVLLRGVAGVGKSTFVKENNLEEYTVSLDVLRKNFLPLDFNETNKVLNNKHNYFIGQIFEELLEYRLQLGGLVVIDNLNTFKNQVDNYDTLAKKYGYEIVVINFEESLETILERNENREGTTKHYSTGIEKRYKDTVEQLPLIKKEYCVIDSKDKGRLNEVLKTNYVLIDSNKYDSVKVIGDIHGCYKQLDKALNLTENGNKLQDNIFYVFLGDYIDRGTENAKVLNLLIENCGKENVVLLEGNHEIYLRAYVEGVDLGYGKEFKNNTLKDILKHNIKKEDLKKIVDELKSGFEFEFKGNKYVCSHGGVVKPELLQYTHFDKVFGIGDYTLDIDYIYNKEVEAYREEDKVTQFHGHRNLFKKTKKQYKYSYNLEGGVDRGGELRVANIIDSVEVFGVEDKENLHYKRNQLPKQEVLDYVDHILNINKGVVRTEDVGERPNALILNSLRFKRGFDLDKKFVNEKIVRGLFYKEDGTIVVRGYDKFYNVGEVKTLEELSEDFSYDVIGYKKENGFLGLVSYSNEVDDFIITTKNVAVNSTTKPNDRNTFALEFRRQFFNMFNNSQLRLLKEFIIKHNITLTFEVISLKDKHIIKEQEDKLVLLDGIKNTLEFKKLKYKKLEELAEDLNKLNKNNIKLELKKVRAKFSKKSKFIKYIIKDKENMLLDHEGLVLEDKDGKMVKYKSLKYFYYKEVRNTFKRLDRRQEDVSKLKNYLNNFMNWHNLTKDMESYQYIEKTYPILEDVYNNKEEFKYDALLGEDYDIPKLIDYVENRLK